MRRETIKADRPTGIKICMRVDNKICTLFLMYYRASSQLHTVLDVRRQEQMVRDGRSLTGGLGRYRDTSVRLPVPPLPTPKSQLYHLLNIQSHPEVLESIPIQCHTSTNYLDSKAKPPCTSCPPFQVLGV